MHIATFVTILLLIPAGPVTIPALPDIYEFAEGMWNMTTQASWHVSQTLSSVDEKVFSLTASLATSSVCALDSLFTFALTVASNTGSLLVDIQDYFETWSVQFRDYVIRVSACIYDCYGDIVSSVSSLFGQGLGFVEQVLSVHKLFPVRNFLSSISAKGFVRVCAVFFFMALCVSLVWMVFEMWEHLGVMNKTIASLAEENRHLMLKMDAEFKTLEERRTENERALTDTENKSKALSMWINVYTSELSRKLEVQSAGQFVRRSLKRQKLL